jgi:hypothetical protein
MNLFILILGIFSTLLFCTEPSTTIVEEVSPNPFFVSIQQDSTPPINNKGTVQIKELGNSKKKKKAPKAKKTKNKQVEIKEPKATKTPKTSKSTAKTKKEKTPKVKKKPISKEQKKSPVVAKTTPDKMPSPQKKPAQKGLSTEEEIKLLSKAKAIDAENKIHPESAKNCRFAFDVIDEFTGVQKRGLDARPFFAYTPDEYRKFIKKDDFIRCEGFLSQSSEGGMALNINLYVASREAKQKFGAIKANSAMVLRTMEGKEYYLMSYPGAEPQVVDNTTYYQCSFAINKSDLKNLQKAEIDQVKISFQKGFQSYDVFYLDFLRDQFPCFED